MKEQNENELLTFGGHLEVFRQMLFRILGVAGVIAVVVFCFKDTTWGILMAPSEWDFCTYRWLEAAMQSVGIDFHFNEFHVNMIATDLSSQFMTHITTAVYLGLLGASPYILYELFRFISPALYENERKYSVQVTPEEKNEILTLFERRNGLNELAKILTVDNAELYEKLVKDLGETGTKFQSWWNNMAEKYQWESDEGGNWEINFDTCKIYLVTNS